MRQTQLRTSQLGDTGMAISRVGFGAWAIGGGGWEFGWGPQTVGRALEGMTQRPYVFTKCSLLDDGIGRVRHSLDRDSIHREAEASLTRLGVDAIDLYQIHWPNPEPDIEEGWAALAELKEQGLVRHIGVIVYSPMGSGLLTGGITRERLATMADDDWRKTDPRFTEPHLTRHLALAERLRTMAERHDTTPGAVAGFRRPDQVGPIGTAANLVLTNSDVADIESALQR
jgi:aryl-alcohol dehydrogenase-like predicted oxidoreductase